MKQVFQESVLMPLHHNTLGKDLGNGIDQFLILQPRFHGLAL